MLPQYTSAGTIIYEPSGGKDFEPVTTLVVCLVGSGKLASTEHFPSRYKSRLETQYFSACETVLDGR